jgi:beta-lactamase class A
MMSTSLLKKISGLILSFLAGALIASVSLYMYMEQQGGPKVTALRESDLNSDIGYQYIDPLLGLKGNERLNSPGYNQLGQIIRNYIGNSIEKNTAKAISVTFRDIKFGGGISINPDEKYNPASLLKVPTMIAYFKLEEKEPGTLKQKIVYTGGTDLNLQEHFRSPIHLQKGETYTVEQLIEYMIRYSDNNAATLLVDHLNKTGHANFVNDLFKDLGIKELSLTEDYLTIQDYVLFFRVLYNSTYLSREMSEKAMELLTRTDFSKGIGAGVPNKIEIAQKFGEFTVFDTTGALVKHEFHQCGIVYYPEHPYLLCVMTKGKDFTDLERVISDISQLVFQYMETSYVTSEIKP